MITVTNYREDFRKFWGTSLCIWEIALHYDTTELVESFNDESIWKSNQPQGANRFAIDNNHLPFINFEKQVTKTKNYLLNQFYKGAKNHIDGVWYKGQDYYINNSAFSGTIYKDLPGFSMDPHLDNHHIMFQLIINLTNNDLGTKFYDLNYGDSYSKQELYVARGEKNTGIVFFNNSNSMHSTSPITKPRYIYYAAITLGVSLHQ